jgi:hypothetical protein
MAIKVSTIGTTNIRQLAQFYLFFLNNYDTVTKKLTVSYIDRHFSY